MTSSHRGVVTGTAEKLAGSQTVSVDDDDDEDDIMVSYSS
jgi:hypothetical protein